MKKDKKEVISMNIYIISDAHLEKVLRSGKAFLQDSSDALKNAAEVIKEDEVLGDKVVIFAGDTCQNKTIAGPALDTLKDVLSDLQDSGIPTYSIMGNHDFDETSIVVTQGAEDLNKRFVQMGPYRVHGINYMAPEDLKKYLKDLKVDGNIDLLVMHQAFKHLLSFEGAFDISMMEIPDNVANVCAGDIHVIDISPMPNGGTFVSAGSLHPGDVSEDYEHGIMRFNSEGWKHISIPQRRIYRETVESVEDLHTLQSKIESIPEDIYKKPVYEVSFPSSLDNEFKTFISKVKEKVHIFPDKYNEELNDILEDMSNIDIKSTMEDHLGRVVDKNKEPALYDFISDILKNGTKEAFMRWADNNNINLQY